MIVLQLWNLYLLLPTETSKGAAQKQKLQTEFLKIRRELNTTSSQDEFAKWAKIRRQHDKQAEQLEKLSMSRENPPTAVYADIKTDKS